MKAVKTTTREEITMDKIPVNKVVNSGIYRLYSGQAFEGSDSIGKRYNIGEALKSGTVNMYVQMHPNAVPGKMYDLGADDIKLKEPLDIIYKIYPGEVLALFPELELVGEGDTEMQALEDLKCEFLDLYEYISNLSEDKLGKGPKAWKDILQRILQS
jgi:hypothetical protein